MNANSDQYTDIDINKYLATLSGYDGLIMTLYGDSPAYSYVMIDKNGYVTLLREKEVISNTATVGIYNFKHGSDFVNSAMKMISQNIRVKNEFYLAPLYNELIIENKKIVCYNAGSIDAGVYCLSVPNDLHKFINNPVSRKAREKLDRVLIRA